MTLSETAVLVPRRRRARRWLPVALISLLTLVTALVGLVSGFLAASVPQTAGRLELPGLQAPVTVYRDQQGIPHIQAETLVDAYTAQGFVTAQDRLFQMEMARRLVSGRLAEVVGQPAVDSDKWFRTLGLDRFGTGSFALYPADVRSYLAAYAAGVNAFISRGNLPPEFTLLGFRPAPWTPEDTLAVGKYMGYMLAGNWRDEIDRLLIRQRAGEAAARELLPVYPAEAPTILGEGAGNAAPAAAAPEADLDWEALLAATALAPDPHNGSNNWALAGTRTYSGQPILAGDPHLSIAIPSQWYGTHLTVPGALNVIGTTVPGVPGITSGHNGAVAWSMTSLIGDSIDLYIEKRNPANPLEFAYGGGFEQAKVRKETIAVKGGEPIALEVVETRHGPLISEVLTSKDKRPAEALAWRWTGSAPSAEFVGLLQMNQAKTVAEWRAAMAPWQHPALSWAMADTRGTIAYQATAGLPRRGRGDGSVPVPGEDPIYEWRGLVPYAELPHQVAPGRGFVYSANNKVGGLPYIGNEFTPYRSMRIQATLERAQGWSAADAAQLQADTFNTQAKGVLGDLLALAGKGAAKEPWSDREADLIAKLTAWAAEPYDTAEDAAPLLFHFWYNALENALYPDNLQFEWHNGIVTDRLIHQAARGQEPVVADDRKTPEQETFADVARRAFRQAVDRAAAEQGNNSAAWAWGKFHRLFIKHPLGGVPVLGGLLNYGSAPVGGSGDTVRASGFDRKTGNVNHGAGYRLVVDLADFNRSGLLVFPGQSGHFLSPHYVDHYDAYQKGELLPLVWDQNQIEQGARLDLVP